MLNKENTVFVLVDVQGKLSKIVQDSEKMIANLKNLIQGLRLLDVPIVWLEQYPEGLGPTNQELTTHLAGIEPIRKITFSACKNPDFMEAIEKTGRKQILIAGIETHICVYQTATGLKDLGYEVEVVADAVSSRVSLNKEIGLEKMKYAGIQWTSVEMALYELMETAEGEQFKRILKLLK
ncbi:hydrolase [Schinkia azotoformans]|uniref:hydrolase n=1 Tax=Schinkia azotoformans TaxID=1454 RepID=UPI002E1BF969|nr:hydrolase [Schinkia azotoformans]